MKESYISTEFCETVNSRFPDRAQALTDAAASGSRAAFFCRRRLSSRGRCGILDKNGKEGDV